MPRRRPASPEVNVGPPAASTSDENERFFRTAPIPDNAATLNKRGQGRRDGTTPQHYEKELFFARTGLPNFTTGSDVHHGTAQGTRRTMRPKEQSSCERFEKKPYFTAHTDHLCLSKCVADVSPKQVNHTCRNGPCLPSRVGPVQSVASLLATSWTLPTARNG